MNQEVAALNPELGLLLQMCNMDRNWVHGEGVWLTDDKGRKFLDSYGQYGAVALGHNAPRVVNAVTAALSQQLPAMVQPYRAPNAIALAEKLVSVAPDGIQHCVFTSSGAETVEAAIKVVRLKTGRSIILSCEGAYHGKTMGAIAATGKGHFRGNEDLLAPGFVQIPFGDSQALDDYLAQHGDEVAAFFLEPVQGERGVYVPPDGYLTKVREICSKYGVAMVLDEIQTGLGRTGRLFCCEHENVSPDLLLLSKALGGGLFPIGACLVSADYWDAKFALSHSSTFANNNISCAAAMAVLDTLEEDKLSENAARLGQRLMTGLQAMAKRYPETIDEVRGKGLLCAMQFHAAKEDQGFFLSYLSHQGLYAYGIASVLAEREGILVLPTLGDANVLRIAPPLVVNESEIDQILLGLEKVVKLLDDNSTDTIVRTLGSLHEPREEIPAKILRQMPPIELPPTEPCEVNDYSYAFLMHYTHLKDIVTTDPALASLSEVEIERYCNYIADMPPGVVYEAPVIRSAAGVEVKGYLIAIGMLPDEMFRRGRAIVSAEISRGVDLAANLGVRVVGLGAFTSVFSRRGTSVAGRAPVVTTGNVLTAAMGYAAIERVLERRDKYISDSVVGVVGAKGSIGSLCAKLLARSQPKKILLVGNPNSSIAHLEQIKAEIQELTRCPIDMTTDFDMLAGCDVILSATSSSQPVLDDAPIKSGTIICDVARPPDASEKLKDRADITVINGGLVSLPDPTVRFGVGNIQGYPDGVQLACLSETILLSMAQVDRDMGVGDNVSLDEVDEIVALAAKHGFTLSEPELDELDYVSDMKQADQARA